MELPSLGFGREGNRSEAENNLFCNQLSQALPGESVVGVKSMADAMNMLLVLHWIRNIAYCDSTKCIFNMIERARKERFAHIN